MSAGKRHNGYPGGNRAIGDSAARRRHPDGAVRVKNHAALRTGGNFSNGALVVQAIGSEFLICGFHHLSRKIKLAGVRKARHDLSHTSAVTAKQLEQQPLEIAGHLNVHRRAERRGHRLALHGAILEEPALSNLGKVKAATGVDLLAQTSNRRIDRGAGRVPVNKLPYPVDHALETLQKVGTFFEKGGADKRQRVEFKGSGMGTKRQEALTVGLFKEGW